MIATLLLLACATEPAPGANLAPAAELAPVAEAAPAALAPSAEAQPAHEPRPIFEAPPSGDPPWPAPPAHALPEASALPDGSNYAALVAAIEADRQIFAGYDSRPQARIYLRDAITRHLFPAWAGTRWAFYGTAEVPGKGEIACGYWVASVLRDVGFRVNRNQLGKQASERILLTFAEPARLRHYRQRLTEAIAWARAAGEGLWGVGLANHAGFLWNDGQNLYFCHSNYNGTRGPECEDADQSRALTTSYTVIASVLDDATVDAWLEGRTLPTGAFRAP